MTNSPTMDALKAATAGLLYPSETDAPFDMSETSTVPDFSTAADESIEEISIAHFFDGLEENPAFQNLRRLLERTLTEIRVFRIGTVEIHIHIIGKTSANTWITLSTLSVETG